MILGRGTATTFEAIVAEYHQLLHDTGRMGSPYYGQLKNTPHTLRKRIGKPLLDWTDEDILGVYQNRQHSTAVLYNAFIAFLIFRGYYRPTLKLLVNLKCRLSQQHAGALAPYRQKISETLVKLCYTEIPNATGIVLRVLIWVLAMTGRPLAELTRADFEAFRDEYLAWYSVGHTARPIDPSLYRLERCLIHWGIIHEARTVLCHEKYFAQLADGPIRQAILTYMQWCDVKYKPSTIYTLRAAILRFFLWFQNHYPECSHLNDVTRPIALEYCRYLKSEVEEGTISSKYRNDLYRRVRLLFEHGINERLEVYPDRNPLDLGDMPKSPCSVPRYIPDHELRVVLEYCSNGATLKERTVVTILLHTGIRAAELASLQTRDIVQIQGRWKLHIREGKGLKDRIVLLTPQCLAVLNAWQADGWERANDHLFTFYGRPYNRGTFVSDLVYKIGRKLGIERLTPHRFRHTFAVALLNYGMRESALQKLMGHTSMNMTLEYARILDRTVEQSFNQAVERMQTGPLSWVPSFFSPDDYTLFTEGDTLNWIRLPHGYCRRHAKLHCESDVKCLLCDRFCALVSDIPRLREMHDRFIQLGMEKKADVVSSHIRLLETGTDDLPALETPQPDYSCLFDRAPFSEKVSVLAAHQE